MMPNGGCSSQPQVSCSLTLVYMERLQLNPVR